MWNLTRFYACMLHFAFYLVYCVIPRWPSLLEGALMVYLMHPHAISCTLFVPILICRRGCALLLGATPHMHAHSFDLCLFLVVHRWHANRPQGMPSCRCQGWRPQVALVLGYWIDFSPYRHHTSLMSRTTCTRFFLRQLQLVSVLAGSSRIRDMRMEHACSHLVILDDARLDARLYLEFSSLTALRRVLVVTIYLVVRFALIKRVSCISADPSVLFATPSRSGLFYPVVSVTLSRMRLPTFCRIFWADVHVVVERQCHTASIIFTLLDIVRLRFHLGSSEPVSPAQCKYMQYGSSVMKSRYPALSISVWLRYACRMDFTFYIISGLRLYEILAVVFCVML